MTVKNVLYRVNSSLTMEISPIKKFRTDDKFSTRDLFSNNETILDQSSFKYQVSRLPNRTSNALCAAEAIGTIPRHLSPTKARGVVIGPARQRVSIGDGVLIGG